MSVKGYNTHRISVPSYVLHESVGAKELSGAH
jgi:hypothetical protein